MPITVTHMEDASVECLAGFLEQLRANQWTYASEGHWSQATLNSLGEPRHVFTASLEGRPLGLLILTGGFLETWGVRLELLGGNPVLPVDDRTPAAHTALLSEATAWIASQGESGMEIMLPMGPDNMQKDEPLDRFFGSIGFRRSYVTMTRDLVSFDPSQSAYGHEIAPAAIASPDELFANYAACLSHNEIELIARQSNAEQRAYFDVMLEETLGHPASLALFDKDQLIGFTLVTDLSEHATHLAWIGILPEFRGNQHGRTLLCETMSTCRSGGSDRMSLYTDVGIDASSMYEQLGFEAAGALTYRWRSSSA